MGRDLPAQRALAAVPMDRFVDPLVLAVEYARNAFPLPVPEGVARLARSGLDSAGHAGLLLALAASMLATWLAVRSRRRSRPGASGGGGGKRPKGKRAPARPRRRLGCCAALGAVAAALVAALGARWWQLGGSWAEAARWWALGSALYRPLSERCAHHRFSYRGLGRPLKTDVPIKEGALCC